MIKFIRVYRFDFINFNFPYYYCQLMNSQGLSIMDLRHTLPNLKYLILSLVSTSPSHLRKFIPHNCTIPHVINNDAIASTSNDRVEEEEGNLHSFSNTSNPIKTIDPSKGSLNVVNKKTTESHRRTSQGFKVGV